MIPVRQLAPPVVVTLVRRQPLTPGKVAFAWRAAAGPALARAGRAELAGDGTIVVTAEEAWAPEIERSRDLLLLRMQAMIGEEVARRVVVRRI